jgi:hypothetical protein
MGMAHPNEVRYSIGSALTTGRNIDSYEHLLGISVKDFRGKRVLDIGTCYGTFQEECLGQGVDAIGLDPYYAYRGKSKKIIERHLSVHENRRYKIAGINETLPFTENSFDAVLSLFSSFFYLGNNYPELALRREMAKKMFEEIVGVLKPGSEARIGPTTYPSDMKFYRPILEEVSENPRTNISWKFVKSKKDIADHVVLYKKKSGKMARLTDSIHLFLRNFEKL